MTGDEIMKIVESIPHSKWDIVRFANIIRNAALEEAAKVSDAHDAIMATVTAQLIGKAIRAMKTKEGACTK